ncbi:MAG: TFIIB-type zinc ribbon-containing protein, partial [Oscillospiraceae bacterium]
MSVVQYKCPNCGGNIEFNSTNHKFECAFCMSSYSEKEIKDIYPELENDALDEDVPEENETAEQSEFADNTALFSCPNCGAEIISESNTSATSCYYCHTPVILKGRLSGKYRPAKIIPFNHDR